MTRFHCLCVLRSISGPEIISLGRRYFLRPRDVITGPEIVSPAQRNISGPEILSLGQRNISGPEIVSLGRRKYLWARDNISGPDISGPEILSLGRRYFLRPRDTISGPEIIFFCARGAYGPPYLYDTALFTQYSPSCSNKCHSLTFTSTAQLFILFSCI